MRGALRAWALALATAVAGSSGCKRAAPVPVGGPAPSVSGLSSAESAQVLARVGNKTITLGDFVAALDHMDSFDRMRYQAPERRKELLEEMIDVALLAEDARTKGLDHDPEVEQETREILRDALLKQVREGFQTPSDIPETEVSAYYEAHRPDFRDPERRRVAAIVLRRAADADEVLAESRATAADWGALVRRHSVAPSGDAGGPPELAGDLGFVSPPGDPRGVNSRVPEEVRAAVYEIADVGGVLSRVVPAGGQFYVVRLQSKTPPHDRTLDDASRMIRVKIAQEKARAGEEQFVASLAARYPVAVDETALGAVKVEIKDAGR